jgi:hypothetical protein
MDFVGPFSEWMGYDYLLVVIFRLTSLVHLIPTTYMEPLNPDFLPQIMGAAMEHTSVAASLMMDARGSSAMPPNRTPSSGDRASSPIASSV